MASRNDVTGPLAPFVEVYAAELRDRGYTTTTVVNDLRQMERLSGWLQARACGCWIWIASVSISSLLGSALVGVTVPLGRVRALFAFRRCCVGWVCWSLRTSGRLAL